MAPLSIPSGGLPLSDFPTDEAGSKKSRTVRGIRIVSAGTEAMEQIIAKMRGGAEAMVSLGKKPVRLQYLPEVL